MASHLQERAQIVQAYLQEKGLNTRVVELQEGARTAQQAADALSCEVGQIIKSLVFATHDTQEPILILASGSNRVDLDAMASHIGKKLVKADPQMVRNVTGYAIGGVPPVAHKQEIRTYIDEDILQYEEVWGAAGTPHTVFCLRPANIALLIPQGTIVRIC